eukprot:2241328-Pleurochrysis_carterae.AAC.1
MIRKERRCRRNNLEAQARLMLITSYSWRTRGNNERTNLEQRVESRRPRSGADNHRVACGRTRRSIRQERKGETQGREA